MNNIKHIIRDIEINKVLELPLTGDSKVIVDFFDNLFSKLTTKTLDDSNTIYMMVGDELFMEQDFENGEPVGYLWCRYIDYWKFLETKANLNYTNVQYLIKYMVGEYLIHKGVTPHNDKYQFLGNIEEQIKSKGIIKPVKAFLKTLDSVEEYLKNNGFTPDVTDIPID